MATLLIAPTVVGKKEISVFAGFGIFLGAQKNLTKRINYTYNYHACFFHSFFSR